MPRRSKRSKPDAPGPAEPACYPQTLFSLLLEHAGSWPAALALSSTCRAARSAWASSPWSRMAPAAAALHRCCTATGHEPSSFAEEIEQIDRVRRMATRAAVRLQFLRAARFWASTVEGSSEALLRAVPRLRLAIRNGHTWLDGPMLYYSFCLMLPGPTDRDPHLFESTICDGDNVHKWSFTYAPAGSVVAREWVRSASDRAESLASSGHGGDGDGDGDTKTAGVHTWKAELDMEDGQGAYRVCRAAKWELCGLLAGLARGLGCSPYDLTVFVFRMIEGTDNHVLNDTIFSESQETRHWSLNSYLVEDNLDYDYP
eukprot:m51a1_g5421 hypothetical protein (315) ;mRNA; f:134668-135722